MLRPTNTINEISGLRTLLLIQLGTVIPFAFFKWIRPSVLQSDSAETIKLILLSLPNFFEGIIGTLLLTGLGLYLNNRILNPAQQLSNRPIYIAAVVLAAIYVITQELKIHNLGGNNVYDPNDILFSILGLALGYGIVVRIKPGRIQG